MPLLDVLKYLNQIKLIKTNKILTLLDKRNKIKMKIWIVLFIFSEPFDKKIKIKGIKKNKNRAWKCSKNKIECYTMINVK